MRGAEIPIEDKLHQAAQLVKAGRKKEARPLLREVLAVDPDNLHAWELLFQATYTAEEEVYCLQHILSLKPDHPWAKSRLAAINHSSSAHPRSPLTETGPLNTRPTSAPRPASKPPAGRKPARRTWLPIAVGVSSLACIGLVAFIILRSGIFSNAFHESSCQALIDRAMQAAGNSCNGIGADQVCYGNTTLQAELVPNAAQRFSQQGDILNVGLLRRLFASPLDLNNSQWGIAIFKVLTNVPRALPGELVTLMVFGNTSLEKSSPGMEAFSFSSELGQIVCDQVPFDGLMISMPYGAGAHFVINGPGD